jgi:peptidoglycan/xylan/chitin deacetylase (PgdA/CDA1 family)
MRLLLHYIFAILVSLTTQETFAAERPPQFVMISFDGSKSTRMWDRTLDFAKEQNGVRFTYFVSGVYFIPDAEILTYTEPSKGAGASAVGFGGEPRVVISRLKKVVRAIYESHEIASHGNGHFDGGRYSENQWDLENTQFKKILKNAWKHEPNSKPRWWDSYVEYEIVGFRAPHLEVGDGLTKSLLNQRYRYDASNIRKMANWPALSDSLLEFPLAAVKIVGSSKNTISMDYNFYVAQSNAKRAVDAELEEFEQEMLDTYKAYFNNNYYGSRAPVDIAHHFSLWNKGIYWSALKRFVRWACVQKEVRCGTYSELANYLQEQSPEVLAEIRRGEFPKVNRSNIRLSTSDTSLVR